MEKLSKIERFTLFAAAFAVILFISILLVGALNSAAFDWVRPANFDTGPFGWIANGLKNLLS